MDYMTALAVAVSVQQERLAEAERTHAPMKKPKLQQAPLPSHFWEMAQALVLGFRQGPAPYP